MLYRLNSLSLFFIFLVLSSSFAEKMYSTGTKGYVIIEAEDIPHSEGWVKETNFNGYTGSGYLRWTGRKHDCNSYGQPKGPHGTDITGNCQGPESDWLKFKVHITETGTYTLNVRNYHPVADVGHGGWLATVSPEYHVVGSGAPPGERYIYKVVNSNVKTWSWATTDVWRFNTYILEPGVYEFYNAARDPEWVADRLYVARWTGPQTVDPAAESEYTEADEKVEVNMVNIESMDFKNTQMKRMADSFSIVSNADGTRSILLKDRHAHLSAFDLRGKMISLNQNGNRIEIPSEFKAAMVVKITDSNGKPRMTVLH